jgi:anti-sigma factor RsiW
MNHPHEDDLLLVAYGELDAPAAAEVERHLASCATCREQFIRLERGRVALEWATWPTAQSKRPARWGRGGAALTVLAAAAAVAAVVIARGPSRDDRPRAWPEQREWSATAGYIAGGRPLITIDAQLTRLEQERSYVLP